MAKIVTQNDLMDVIQAEITNLNDLIELVTNSIDITLKNISYSVKWKNNAKKYKDILDITFGDFGILVGIENAIDSLNKFSKNTDLTQIENLIKSDILNKTLEYLYNVFKTFDKINIKIQQGILYKLYFSKYLFRAVYEFVNALNDVNISFKQLIASAINPGAITRTIKSIGEIFDILNTIKITPAIFIKLKWITFTIKRIKKLIFCILDLSEMWKDMIQSMLTLIALDQIINLIELFVNKINDIKIDLFILLKLQWVNFAIEKIEVLINTLSKLTKKRNDILNALLIFGSINIILVLVQQLFISINELPFVSLVKRKLKKLIKTIGLLDPVIESITNIGKGFPNYKTTLKRWISILITFYMFKKFISLINSINIPILFKFRINLLLKSIYRINNIILAIKDINFTNSVKKKISDLILFVENIKKLLNLILSTISISLLIPIGLLAIKSSLLLIQNIIGLIIKIFKGAPLKYLIRRLNQLNTIFSILKNIFINIAIITPFAIIGIIGLVIITAAISIMLLLIKLISIISKILLKGNIIWALLQISLIIIILTIITLQLTILAAFATIIAANALNLLKFFGILLAVVVAVTLIGWLANLASSIIGTALLGMGLIILAIGTLVLIAWELKYIQSFKLDKEAIINNVDAVIGTCKYIIENIFKPTDIQEGESKGWLMKIIEFIGGPIVSIATALMAVPFLALSVASIGLIILLSKQLDKLQIINLDKNKIILNVSTVTSTAQSVIDSLFSEHKEKSFWNRIKGFTNNIKSDAMTLSLANSIDLIVKLAENLNKLSDVKTFDNKTESLNKILDSIYKIGNINSNYSKNNILKDSITFIEKIDKVKLDNLTKAASIFEAMARFSESIQGNFEGLADSLNEKIAPLLEELNEMIGKMPDNVNNAAANISSSISANAMGPTMTPQATMAQVQRENPKAEQAEIERLANEKLKENYQAMSQSITSKFDELIELIRNGEGKIQITD